MPVATAIHATVDDSVLVARAKRGDREAMMLLYRRYVDELFGYAYNQLGNAQDAEDLTSETFLRLVRAIDGFDGRSSFRTWIYTVMRNQLRDFWRRNGRRPTILLEDRPMAVLASQIEAPSEAEPEASSKATRLGREVMAALPDNYRRVLQLRILDGRSIRDTAEALAMSQNNVKVTQHRALKRAAHIAAVLNSDGETDEA